MGSSLGGARFISVFWRFIGVEIQGPYLRLEKEGLEPKRTHRYGLTNGFLVRRITYSQFSFSWKRSTESNLKKRHTVHRCWEPQQLLRRSDINILFWSRPGVFVALDRVRVRKHQFRSIFPSYIMKRVTSQLHEIHRQFHRNIQIPGCREGRVWSVFCSEELSKEEVE